MSTYCDRRKATSNQLNRLRLAVIHRLLACILLFSALGILLAVKTDALFAFSVFIVLVPVLTWLAICPSRNRYRAAYKRAFVKDALQSQFTDLEYSPREGIPRETIAATQMMCMGTSFHAEDYVRARYRDIPFEQSDVLIQTSNGKTVVTLFQGQWMIFDFNKPFRTNFQIVQKGFRNAKHRRFFGPEDSLFQKISMESEAFNEGFRVYAQNEHDAFYVITPALMERLQHLANHCEGKLMFCFAGKRLHIAIDNNRDYFEPGSIFREIEPQIATWKVRSELSAVTGLISELSLDNDLFIQEV